MRKFRHAFAIFALFFIWTSCQHKISDDELNNVVIDVNCDPNVVYFVNDIQPILTSNCAYAGCHDAITHKEGYDFSSYAAIMSSDGVNAGNANNSELYEVLNKTSGDMMPPPPKSALTTEQKNKIRDWINQGAKNNQCNGCDSTNITFATKIWPIMQSNCQGCHSGSNPSGSISITNYTQVNALVQNGSLIGTITSQSGYSPMPKGGQLTSCDIAIIKSWIQNGAQNN